MFSMAFNVLSSMMELILFTRIYIVADVIHFHIVCAHSIYGLVRESKIMIRRFLLYYVLLFDVFDWWFQLWASSMLLRLIFRLVFSIAGSINRE